MSILKGNNTKASGSMYRVCSERLGCQTSAFSRPFASSSKSFLETEKSVRPRGSTLAAYSDLAKAKLSALVVTTSAAGYVAAAGPVLTSDFALCMMGTALCSSSAAAFNQIFEIDRDSCMKRTQTRPLVTGALSPAEAKAAATLWGVSGTALLTMTDPIAAALGFGNILLYSVVYTYLKPRSVINTWVGAVVGAVPPLVRSLLAIVTSCLLIGRFLPSRLDCRLVTQPPREVH
jgi:protoheme IX farnesyltransferase